MARPPTQAEQDAIVGAVQRHFGAEPLAAGTIHRSRRTDVYLVQLQHWDFVLKVIHSKLKRSLSCEHVATAMRQRGIPTPRPLAWDRLDPSFQRPIVISERVRGVPMSRWLARESPPSETVRQIARQLGRHLQLLHEIEIDGFGPVKDNGLGPYGSWRQYLGSRMLRTGSGEELDPLDLEALLRLGIVERERASAIGRVFDEADFYRGRAPRLLHNDLNLGNILIDAGREEISSILDLHNAIGGDPTYELARFLYFHRHDALIAPLLEGYGDVGDEFEMRLHFHTVIVVLEKLAWLRGREHRFPKRRDQDLQMLDHALEELERYSLFSA